MEVKKAVEIKVPVRMLDASGVGITGLAFEDVTVYIQKQAGLSTLKTLVISDWTEIDATNMPGVYDLLLLVGDLDTVGFFKYAVSAVSALPFIGLIEVVENLESDSFSAISATSETLDTIDSTTTGIDAGVSLALIRLNTITKFTEGRWQIVNNQLIIFDTDGETTFAIFDLFDDQGQPSQTKIFERKPFEPGPG